MADSGYVVSGPYRDGLAERGMHSIVGVTAEKVVFTEEPWWVKPEAATGGRPRRRVEGPPRPVSLRDPAVRTPWHKMTWWGGTKGPMWGRFSWLRVWPGQGVARGSAPGPSRSGS